MVLILFASIPVRSVKLIRLLSHINRTGRTNLFEKKDDSNRSSFFILINRQYQHNQQCNSTQFANLAVGTKMHLPISELEFRFNFVNVNDYYGN